MPEKKIHQRPFHRALAERGAEAQAAFDEAQRQLAFPYQGVTWVKGDQRFVALARKDGKRNFIGSSTDVLEAAAAYQRWVKENDPQSIIKRGRSSGYFVAPSDLPDRVLDGRMAAPKRNPGTGFFGVFQDKNGRFRWSVALGYQKIKKRGFARTALLAAEAREEFITRENIKTAWLNFPKEPQKWLCLRGHDKNIVGVCNRWQCAECLRIMSLVKRRSCFGTPAADRVAEAQKQVAQTA